jgi:hypothetical protein
VVTSIYATVSDSVLQHIPAPFFALNLRGAAAAFSPEQTRQIARPQHNVQESGAIEVVQFNLAQRNLQCASRTLIQGAHYLSKSRRAVRGHHPAIGICQQLIAPAAKMIEAQILWA